MKNSIEEIPDESRGAFTLEEWTNTVPEYWSLSEEDLATFTALKEALYQFATSKNFPLFLHAVVGENRDSQQCQTSVYHASVNRVSCTILRINAILGDNVHEFIAISQAALKKRELETGGEED